MTRAEPLQPPPLRSPIPANADRRELERQLSQTYGYRVDLDRYEKLVTDTTIVDITGIAEMAGVERTTVVMWRSNSNPRRGGGPGPSALPPEDGMAGQSPWWFAGNVRRTLIERGLMRPDGTPIRPLRPGRAPASRAA